MNVHEASDVECEFHKTDVSDPQKLAIDKRAHKLHYVGRIIDNLHKPGGEAEQRQQDIIALDQTTNKAGTAPRRR